MEATSERNKICNIFNKFNDLDKNYIPSQTIRDPIYSSNIPLAMKLQHKTFNIKYFKNKFGLRMYDNFIYEAILGDIGMITLPMKQYWEILV